MDDIVFIDTEVGVTDRKIHDIGAVNPRGMVMHSPRTDDLIDFLQQTEFVGGHNFIHHDWTYLSPALEGRVRVKAIMCSWVSSRIRNAKC